jgi:hypothetical protein
MVMSGKWSHFGGALKLLSKLQKTTQAACRTLHIYAGGSEMNCTTLTSRFIAGIAVTLVLGACASDPDKLPSENYEEVSAKTESMTCPMGHVLICESRRTGRIRFGSIGGKSLESCNCEPDSDMTDNSALGRIF